MKQIQLKKLILQNFKGIKSLEVDFEQITNIYGKNEGGKTSIHDAFSWLLFDKDAQGRTQFDIKTFDENNKVIHQLEHFVEGHIDVDGRIIRLKKIYKEIWRSKRGAEQSMDGHETLYFVDDVPYLKKDYNPKIEEILDEEIFKIVTSPTYFNELEKKKQRDMLFLLAGEVETSEIIALNPMFSELEDELKYKSTDELKKMLDNQRKELKKQKENIPSRIDEVNRQIPLQPLSKNTVTQEFNRISDVLKSYENYNKELTNKQQELNTLNSRLFDEEREHQKVQNDLKMATTGDYHNKVAELNAETIKLENTIRELKDYLYEQNKTIEHTQLSVDNLRNDYIELNSKSFELDENSLNCPTCGQEVKNADEIMEEQEKKFNENKANKLADIQSHGKKYNELIDICKKNVDDTETRLNQLNSELSVKVADLNELRSKPIKFIEQPFTPNKKTLAEIEKVKKAIAEFADADGQRAKYVDELAIVQKQLTEIIATEQAQKRIIELQDEELNISSLIAENERVSHILREFVVARINHIQKSVDEHFTITKFNLFETQVNGEIKETCEAVNNGKPYRTMSTAQKANVGVDVINAFQKYYNVVAPIVFDNRESVSNIIDTDAQIVNLIVSESDETLRIEVGK